MPSAVSVSVSLAVQTSGFAIVSLRFFSMPLLFLIHLEAAIHKFSGVLS